MAITGTIFTILSKRFINSASKGVNLLQKNKNGLDNYEDSMRHGLIYAVKIHWETDIEWEWITAFYTNTIKCSKAYSIKPHLFSKASSALIRKWTDFLLFPYLHFFFLYISSNLRLSHLILNLVSLMSNLYN